MRLLTAFSVIQLAIVLPSAEAQTPEVKSKSTKYLRSKEAKLRACEAIRDEIDERNAEFPHVDGFDVTACREAQNKFLVLDSNTKVPSYKVRYNDGAIECELEVYQNRGRWTASVDRCVVPAHARVFSAQPGFSYVSRIQEKDLAEKIGKKILETIHGHDRVVIIGYDGYYSDLEETFATVKDKSNNVLGYLQAIAYEYSEDPDVHVWLFHYNEQGFLVKHSQLNSIEVEEFKKGYTWRMFDWN